tara:strand:- start:155 stop:301 length:147 start_codon:yes stop_codon:yes gene_type:complete
MYQFMEVKSQLRKIWLRNFVGNNEKCCIEELVRIETVKVLLKESAGLT